MNGRIVVFLNGVAEGYRFSLLGHLKNFTGIKSRKWLISSLQQ